MPERIRKKEALMPFVVRLTHVLTALVIAAFSSLLHAQPSPPVKTLHVGLQYLGGDPLDPAQINSITGANIIENIVEPMLRYDYLARPLQLMPNTLVAMPEVSEGGRVYTCRIKPGILFAPDIAFKGKPRELTAADYAYSIRRLFDPQFLSSQFFVIDGKIVGANALRDAAIKAKRFDYDKPIEGLKVIDRYTLRITLTAPDLNFPHVLAQQNLAAIAREVVEYYGSDIRAHPVGTGPFQVESWREGSKMVLTANPHYREEVFPAAPANADDAVKKTSAKLAGRKLPMVNRIEVAFTVEDQPLWLSFLGADLDYLINVPVAFRPGAVPNGALAPNLVRRGVQVQHYAYPAIWYTSFNMKDPVIGGYAPEKIALRRAIALAFDNRAAIAIAMNGGALPVRSVVPPGVPGYDASFESDVFVQNLAKAHALLDTYGYIDRDGDGYRENPDGSKLVIEQSSTPDTTIKQYDELWRKNMDAIGLKMVFNKAKWPDLNKQSLLGKLTMFQQAWSADYPDAENFYQNLYSKNIGESNRAKFKLPAFDKLYEQARMMPPSPERNKLYSEMARLVAAYAPWIPDVHRLRSDVVQPWTIGYLKHPILNAPWLFMDVDETKRVAR